MTTIDTITWTPEGTWHAVLGAYETPESVLAEAESQSITPQDYVRSAVEESISQGADFDRDDTYADLCRQLGIDR
jgi:hypothetical protein